MKEPIQRPKYRYWKADSWSAAARFERCDDLEQPTWFDIARRCWREYNDDRWTFKRLKELYPEMIELTPTRKLVKTGRP